MITLEFVYNILVITISKLNSTRYSPLTCVIELPLVVKSMVHKTESLINKNITVGRNNILETKTRFQRTVIKYYARNNVLRSPDLLFPLLNLKKTNDATQFPI